MHYNKRHDEIELETEKSQSHEIYFIFNITKRKLSYFLVIIFYRNKAIFHSNDNLKTDSMIKKRFLYTNESVLIY